jgi:hypothetical protein
MESLERSRTGIGSEIIGARVGSVRTFHQSFWCLPHFQAAAAVCGLPATKSKAVTHGRTFHQVPVPAPAVVDDSRVTKIFLSPVLLHQSTTNPTTLTTPSSLISNSLQFPLPSSLSHPLSPSSISLFIYSSALTCPRHFRRLHRLQHH